MAEGGLHRKTEETDTCLCLSPRLDSHGDWSQATCGSACQSPSCGERFPGEGHLTHLAQSLAGR